MKCFIYRSRQQDEMYLYLKTRSDFSVVPPELMKHFVNPEFVFELDLSSIPRLARADIHRVVKSLHSQGYYLQLPPPKVTAR